MSRYAAMFDRLGAEEALQAVQPEDRLGQRIAPRLETLDVARDLEIARTLGARIVVPGDNEWPAGFASLLDPPLCLWVRGTLELAAECERSVSVVGARAAIWGAGRKDGRDACPPRLLDLWLNSRSRPVVRWGRVLR